MKTKLHCLFSLLAMLAGPHQAAAQGSAFTYQGQLSANGAPANGRYDLTFTLYDSTNLPGKVIAGPLINAATAVSNGLFAVTLDFGGGVFTGTNYWLGISVSPAGSNTFTELSPRQPLTPTPYAIMAGSASNLLGDLPAAQLSGTIPLAQLPGAVVTNNDASSVNLSGTFTGDGGGLTNLNAGSLTGTAATLSVGNTLVNSNLYLPPTTANAGIIYSGGSTLMHGFGTNSLFAGAGAGNLTLTGNDNTGLGVNALQNNTTGSSNTATGEEALLFNLTGDYNTANGFEALANNTSGSNNIAMGYEAGSNITTGSYNIDIGNAGVAGDGNIIRIGTPGTHTNAFIAGQIVGDGSGLTNLNASEILSGTISAAQLPGTVITNYAANVTLGGAFAGDGSGLTNLASAIIFSGFLSGDVTGTQGATVVSSVGGQSAANIASGLSAVINADSANIPGAIVERDGSGNFSANAITAGSFTGAVAASNLTGTISPVNLPAALVSNNATGVTLSLTNSMYSGITLGSGTMVFGTNVPCDDAYPGFGQTFDMNFYGPSGSGGAETGGILMYNDQGVSMILSPSSGAIALQGFITLGMSSGVVWQNQLTFSAMMTCTQDTSDAFDFQVWSPNVNVERVFEPIDDSLDMTNAMYPQGAVGWQLTGKGFATITRRQALEGTLGVQLILGDDYSGNNFGLNDQNGVLSIGSVTGTGAGAQMTGTPVIIDTGGNLSATSFKGDGSGLTNLTMANIFSGYFSGDVTGTQNATVVSSVGGQSAANIASGVSAVINADSANIPGAIVERDGSGNFSANAITAGSFIGAVAASNLTGTILPANLPAAFVSNNATGVTLSLTNSMFSGITLGSGTMVFGTNVPCNDVYPGFGQTFDMNFYGPSGSGGAETGGILMYNDQGVSMILSPNTGAIAVNGFITLGMTSGIEWENQLTFSAMMTCTQDTSDAFEFQVYSPNVNVERVFEPIDGSLDMTNAMYPQGAVGWQLTGKGFATITRRQALEGTLGVQLILGDDYSGNNFGLNDQNGVLSIGSVTGTGAGAQMTGTPVIIDTGGDLSATSFKGDGSGLANLHATNIVGGYNGNVVCGNVTLYITNGIIMAVH